VFSSRCAAYVTMAEYAMRAKPSGSTSYGAAFAGLEPSTTTYSLVETRPDLHG